MKDVTVRTTIAAEDTKDGKEFNGGRTFPFPEKMEELNTWLKGYADLAKSKNWETQPDFLADAETGFRIRVGKEIREKARLNFGKPESEKPASERKEAPVGTVL